MYHHNHVWSESTLFRQTVSGLVGCWLLADASEEAARKGSLQARLYAANLLNFNCGSRQALKEENGLTVRDSS
jgi:hypothetical protein